MIKKLVSTVATGVLIAGVTVSSVSAAEVEVHKGDTLWGIARSQNTTVEELMNVNNLQSTIIHPNQILLIDDEQYTVKKGDTLSGIAYKLGVTVKELKDSNNLTTDLILIGQVLTINGGAPVKEAPVTNNEVSEEPAVEPVEEEPAEEPASEPVEEETTEEPASEPVEEEIAEEPATEPVEEETTEEPASEPVEEETVEKPATEPVEEETTEEPASEPVEEETTEEPAVEPVEEEAAEEPASEPVEEKASKESTEQKAPKQNAQKDNSKTNATKQAEPAKQESGDKAEGKVINATATAYTAKCDGCTGVTSTGVDLNANPNAKVIAVDPSVIPLGSKVYVEGYGYATAADVGSGIKGNKIDVHLPTKNEALNWGNKAVKVTIVK
ncbi:3D (Asp-Asp-Asp) domain-containing protein [Virgibacillus halotolerans]|uniref:LysM peptidoglycan-binding domain-containing protein n=1 Tax=Virgibacillus halotolerans TaxID=1071053 RepID=UPI0019617B43|nr:LysM peptidoglycan-binding domain-containing protein [Virgibacillus halotolerans]MBM7600329.1 3D (Asp-Asp-Asp) domain-containing protein [Virgibacillus halotolerans]